MSAAKTKKKSTRRKKSRDYMQQVVKSTNIQARDYQERIVNKALHNFLVEDVKSQLIESPCGSGKSIMGLSIAKTLHDHGLSIAWCAMRRNLLTQAAKENREKGFNFDMATVSMFESDPKQADVLIVDEAQHDSTDSMNTIHSTVKPKLILGLSATPYRADKANLCFQKVLKDAGINQLIQRGYLSKYRHWTLNDWTPESVANCYLQDPKHWGKSVAFFLTEDECLEFQDRLRQKKVKCELVTAKTDRERQLAAFEKGEVPVLVNMMILTEGFDCPSMQSVFVRPSSKGPTVQMGGRVLRLHDALPVKNIVQCQRTKHPFLKTAMPITQYKHENSSWKELKLNPAIDRIANTMTEKMMAIYTRQIAEQNRK